MGEPTVDEQILELARRYSQRAAAYDSLWSPAIQPLGERLLERLPLAEAEHVIDIGTGAGALLPAIRRAAPRAAILGIDRSEGMLQLARGRHDGPLALMDAQSLELPNDRFDIAIVAFVLFHLPDPQRCLEEVFRVLKPQGWVGTATWGVERFAAANVVWDEELTAAAAATFPLPATDNRTCCDSEVKITRLLERAGFIEVRTSTESLDHRWRPEDHFEYQLRSTSRLRLDSLDAARRDECLQRVRTRLSAAGKEMYVFRGEVVMATAAKPEAC
ncbi:MAG: methyltransferase domain-containing protein [Candidatus Dormibacteraeota bacterium]|nr:methyltransferase domain-containing protein [Candidatus Dormibacteraeota bacterium]